MRLGRTFAVAMTVFGGRLARALFRLYLSVCLRWFGVHANAAFGAMSLDRCNNFRQILLRSLSDLVLIGRV